MQRSLALSPTSGSFAPLFFQGDVEAGIEAAARGDFHAVELSVRAREDLNVQDVKRRLASTSLGVSAVATGKVFYEDGISLLSDSKAARQAALERVGTLVELAAELNAPYVIVGGVRGRFPAEGPTDTALTMLTDGIGALAQVAARHGLAVLVEPINRYETDALNTAWSAARLISEIGSKHIGILLDTFHMNLEEASVATTFARHFPLVRYVHFADNHRRIPGDGTLPFLEWLRVLDALGFDGFIGIEALPLPDDATAARRSGERLRAWMSQVADESSR